MRFRSHFQNLLVLFVSFVFALSMAVPEIEYVFAQEGDGDPTQEETRENEETQNEEFPESQNEETEAFEEETHEDGEHEVPGEEWRNEEEETEETRNEDEEPPEENESVRENEEHEDQREAEVPPQEEGARESEVRSENVEVNLEGIAEDLEDFSEWLGEVAENQEYEEEEEEEEGGFWRLCIADASDYAQSGSPANAQYDACIAQFITDREDAPSVHTLDDQLEELGDALSFELTER